MEAPQHIVNLSPTAVELVDRTMIGLARGNPAYRAVVEKFVRGDPDAILLSSSSETIATRRLTSSSGSPRSWPTSAIRTA